MSVPHYAKPLFTAQLRVRLPTSKEIDTSDLFLRSDSIWSLSQRISGQFAVQSSNARIPHLRESNLTALKWFFNRFGTRALLNRGRKPEDPVPEKTVLLSESAYMHDYPSSSFHKLPIELVLEITHHLSPVARLVMQRVCSKFRRALAPHGISPELKSDIVTAREIFQFAFLLRRDLQLRLQDDCDQRCDLESPNSILHRFGCSGCRTTHNIKNFSAKQLTLSPKIRICKGLEASFQLCVHLSFSGLCLLQGLREMKNTELFCQAGHVWDIHSKYSLAVGGRQSGPHVGFHGGHTITIDQVIPILVLEENEKAPHNLLSFALREKRAYICPHLNSSSPELFGGRPMTAECPDYTFSEIQILQQRYECRVPCHCSEDCCQLRLGKCVI